MRSAIRAVAAWATALVVAVVVVVWETVIELALV